jgi:uncharacterized membrane protein YhaH (DUF805 family)
MEGRLNRQAYIGRILLVYVTLYGSALLMHPMFRASRHTRGSGGLLFLVVLGVCAVAGISFKARRLHDLGKSGWYVLLTFVPLVSLALELFLWLKKGTEGPNAYGPDPLGDNVSELVRAFE